MSPLSSWCTTLAAGVLVGAAFTPLAAQEDHDVREVIRRHVEQIRTVGGVTLEGDEIASAIVLPQVYERRGFAPLWAPAAMDDMMRAIDDASLDGLEPSDYHREPLLTLRRRVAEGSRDAETIGDLDMLLTDALVRLGYHILFGKVDPERLDPNWNLAGELGSLDPVDAVEAAIGSGRLYDIIEGYKPSDPFYVDLKAALARYRAIAGNGGWHPVPDIARLELDSVDARVPSVRARLRVTGELPESASLTSETFDPELDAAVRTFQRRHGLRDDGVVGRNTVAAMNVPAEDRIEQIRVNLERGRWVLRELGDSFVMVNIAGFRVYLVEDRHTEWTSRVVVGTQFHKTPLFRATLQYIVLNPTWTVPPSIVANETLPFVKRDPSYLSSNHMTLLDRSGRVVDPAGVDFQRYSGGDFPFVVRQEPGPWNALGRVKFIFPNDHFVFLHDTPSRNLFDREVRTFSHGCIRVENPLELATLLLRGKAGWDRPAIDRALASGEPTTVYLDEPLPTLLLYWTAWVDPDAGLTFYPDVYDRDPAISAGLEESFRFRLRPVMETVGR